MKDIVIHVAAFVFCVFAALALAYAGSRVGTFVFLGLAAASVLSSRYGSVPVRRRP